MRPVLATLKATIPREAPTDHRTRRALRRPALFEAGLTVRDALEARPASEPPWEALRAAFENLKISKMLYGTPSRLGAETGDAPDPRAQAIVACALTCLSVASETWTRSDGEADPRQLFDRAVAAVRG